ncbi:MAG: 4Fe-4S dicluster domain-containing protein [Sulfurospirillum sp.]|nr:4Fe-4S dicluster domain-containing protein [Sulfurospirillum sp.]
MRNMQRREVFSSFASRFKKTDTSIVRPPYCDQIELFNQKCPACIDKPCVNACNEKIIFIDKEGLAALVFDQNGCTYCEKCALTCMGAVLSLTCKDMRIQATFSISTQKCLAWQSVMCSSCLDACNERAIQFFGVFRPIIKKESCTNCGMCVSVCPSDALEIKGARQ